MGKAKILVVDDDEALAEMIGIVLRNDGFEPTFAADGTSALPAFHRERPDLVLLDLMLPGIDGIEVCRLIRAESDVPIVMLTAKSDTADVVRGLESGADDYVPKPFKPAELVARVRARLREGRPSRRRSCTSGTSRSTWRATRSPAAASASPSPRWSSISSWPSPGGRATSSPARCSWRRSGATGTRPTPGS